MVSYFKSVFAKLIENSVGYSKKTIFWCVNEPGMRSMIRQCKYSIRFLNDGVFICLRDIHIWHNAKSFMCLHVRKNAVMIWADVVVRPVWRLVAVARRRLCLCLIHFHFHYMISIFMSKWEFYERIPGIGLSPFIESFLHTWHVFSLMNLLISFTSSLIVWMFVLQ